MITPSFGLTATERVLPRLALDFTTANLDSRITFTRTGNTATVINSSGLVAPVNANIPRFDYDPTTLICRGLLIEEQRTNLATYSEDFTDASWLKNNGGVGVAPVVTANQETSPSGTLTADRVVLDIGAGTASTDNSRIEKNITPVNGTTYSYSFWAKSATASNYVVQVRFSGITALRTITPVWQRFTVSGTATADTTPFYIWLRGNVATSKFADFYLWGAQIEEGAFATSYIPTVASQVTRSADVATMTGTNFSDWFNATQGTIVCTSSSPGTFVPFEITDGTVSNFIGIRNRAQGTVGLSCGVVSFGGSVVAQIIGNPFNAVNTVALAYKANDFAGTMNATAVQLDTVGALPTVSLANIGRAATTVFTGHVAKVLYYSQRLTNNEVVAFSKG